MIAIDAPVHGGPGAAALALSADVTAKTGAIKLLEFWRDVFVKTHNAPITRNGPHMITVAAGILKQDGRILICQRKRTGAFPLQWEFPGGKVEIGEDAQTCLKRELREELAVEAEIGPEVSTFQYTYPNGFQVNLVFFLVRGYAGEMANLAFEQILWVESHELPNYDFLEADRELVACLTRGELV
jgi:8-oxo-dGTP diphosphatase